MQPCRLCPRLCGARRDEQRGYCGAGDGVIIARAMLHFGEEPCLVGTQGSGAVFFSGCPLGCVYCQNADITAGLVGERVDEERLAALFLRLLDAGALNLNLVTATPYAPQVARALRIVKHERKESIVVWNTSSFETPETLSMLEGLIDVYLADFRYWEPESARRYSNSASYVKIAREAFDVMYAQTGRLCFDEEGILHKGIIARVLVLPGHTEQAKRIIAYLWQMYGNDIRLSILSQYTPCHRAKAYPEINRTLTEEEYTDVVEYLSGIGIKEAYIQTMDAAGEAYIPDFYDQGLL